MKKGCNFKTERNNQKEILIRKEKTRTNERKEKENLKKKPDKLRREFYFLSERERRI